MISLSSSLFKGKAASTRSLQQYFNSKEVSHMTMKHCVWRDILDLEFEDGGDRPFFVTKTLLRFTVTTLQHEGYGRRRKVKLNTIARQHLGLKADRMSRAVRPRYALKPMNKQELLISHSSVCRFLSNRGKEQFQAAECYTIVEDQKGTQSSCEGCNSFAAVSPRT